MYIHIYIHTYTYKYICIYIYIYIYIFLIQKVKCVHGYEAHVCITWIIRGFVPVCVCVCARARDNAGSRVKVFVWKLYIFTCIYIRGWDHFLYVCMQTSYLCVYVMK